MKNKRNVVFLLIISFGLTGCAVSSFFSAENLSPSISQRVASCLNIQSKSAGAERNTEWCNLLALAMQNFDDEKYTDSENNFLQSTKNFKPSNGAAPGENLKLSYYGLAASYDQEGRFKEADASYEKIRKLFGEDLRYYNNLGYSLYLRGKTDAAITTIKKALVLEPNNPVTLENYKLVTGG